MAVTGTGTVGDPYIVTTWEDFLSVAIGDVYIKCADNCVWDFNEIAPEGVSNIVLKFLNWDGNGVKIMNLAHRNPNDTTKFGISFGEGSADNTTREIKNINFLNCYLNSNYYGNEAQALFKFIGNYIISNSTFSVYSANGVVFGCSTARSAGFPQFRRCSLTIYAYGNSCFTCQRQSGYYFDFVDCKLNFDGISNQKMDHFAYVFFENSKVVGKIPYGTMNLRVNTSVIDAEIRDNSRITSIIIAITLINSDKIGDNVTFSGNLTQVTSEELKDVSALQQKGFPIVSG